MLARREQDVELARVRFVGDRGGEAEKFVVSPMAEDDHHEVMTSGALTCDPSRDPLDPEPSAPATDEPPYFWTTRGAGMRGILLPRFGAPNRKRCWKPRSARDATIDPS